MRDLRDINIGQRVMVTVVIVVVILLLLAVIGYLSGRWEVDTAQGATGEFKTVSKWDDHIDMLEKQALDSAFQKHIAQLFSIWVTDNYQPKIPPRALTGARNARDAYIRSMEAIENREQPPRPK
jgi:hypothetical protein